MRYLKPYIIFESNIYEIDWKKIMPNEMKVLKDGEHTFKLGNIMKDANMIQICYENSKNEWGVPSTLEFDFYFSEDPKNRLDVDITWGDSMACEFYIEKPNRVGVIEYTSFGSKADTSNTIFAIEEESLKSFVDVLNRLDGFRVDFNQFQFLSEKGID